MSSDRPHTAHSVWSAWIDATRSRLARVSVVWVLSVIVLVIAHPNPDGFDWYSGAIGVDAFAVVVIVRSALRLARMGREEPPLDASSE